MSDETVDLRGMDPESAALALILASEARLTVKVTSDQASEIIAVLAKLGKCDHGTVRI